MLHAVRQIQRRWPSHAHRVVPGLLAVSAALPLLGAGLSL